MNVPHRIPTQLFFYMKYLHILGCLAVSFALGACSTSSGIADGVLSAPGNALGAVGNAGSSVASGAAGAVGSGASGAVNAGQAAAGVFR